MYFSESRACFLRLLMPFVFVPRGFGRAPRGTAVPLSSGSDRGLGRVATPQRALGTFRRWKVPRRRLLQKRFVRRAGIRFAYLVRTVLCQSERGIFQNQRAAEGCGPYGVRLTVARGPQKKSIITKKAPTGCFLHVIYFSEMVQRASAYSSKIPINSLRLRPVFAAISLTCSTISSFTRTENVR